MATPCRFLDVLKQRLTGPDPDFGDWMCTFTTGVEVIKTARELARDARSQSICVVVPELNSSGIGGLIKQTALNPGPAVMDDETPAASTATPLPRESESEDEEVERALRFAPPPGVKAIMHM